MIRTLESQFSYGPTPAAPVQVMRLCVEVEPVERGSVELILDNFWNKWHRLFEQQGCVVRRDVFFPTSDIGISEAVVHAFGELLLAIANLSGQRLDYLSVSAINDESGAFLLSVAYDCSTAGHRSCQVAEQMFNQEAELFLQDKKTKGAEGQDLERIIQELSILIQGMSLDISSVRIRDAAMRLGIPTFRIDPLAKFIQLGTGCHRIRFLYSNNDRTSFVAAKLSSNKAIANRVLSRAGFPVPEQRVVHSEQGALDAARDMNWPVVIKPRSLGQGIGVSLNLASDEDVRIGWKRAVRHEKTVLVEQMLKGLDFRLLVANGQLIGASLRIPAQVIGDGHHSIKELVEIENDRPERMARYGSNLKLLKLDDVALETLQRQAITASSVPASGVNVLLREVANISQGGDAEDVSDKVHPDNCRLAIEAAELLGLDVAGVDLLIPDISVSWKQSLAGILEVNTSPGFVTKWLEEGDQVINRLVASYFPENTAHSIPTVAIVGEDRQLIAECGRILDKILNHAGYYTGRADADGLSLGGEMISDSPRNHFFDLRTLLSHPKVEAAIMGTCLDNIEQEGLVLESFSSVTVLETSSGESCATSAFILSRAEAGAVVSADAKASELLHQNKAQSYLYGEQASHPAILEHLKAGGIAVCGNTVYFGVSKTVELNAPASQALSAAIATALSLSVSLETIAEVISDLSLAEKNIS